MASKPLRLVDPETGELSACPQCHNWELTYTELERKYRGALSQLGQRRESDLEKARNSPNWGWAVAVFQEWKVATHHPMAVWTYDRFATCEPFLESHPFSDHRYAVWGLAANCFQKRVTQNFSRRYDEFWRVYGSSAGVQSADHFEAHVNEGRAIFGSDLPEGDWERLLYVHRSRGMRR